MPRDPPLPGQLRLALPEEPFPVAPTRVALGHPWVAPKHTKTRVDKAGKALRAGAATEADLEVINNWRSSHSFALNTFQMSLRRKASKLDGGSFSAQRLKRLSSIKKKLENSTMKLSQMQDIGGCRAVLHDVRVVRVLRDRYTKSRHRHELIDEDDYIQAPRESGYRGIHLVYKYRSKDRPEFNGLRIELQLRSRLQHAWATAVETVETFTQQALKASQGDARWLRFFKLMGSAIALRENSPLVAGTPTSQGDLRAELWSVTSELDVRQTLESYHVALSLTEKAEPDAHYFLIKIEPHAGRIVATAFARRDVEKATEEYLKWEKALPDEPGSQVVLVSAVSLDALKRAYPNYFVDTKNFLNAMQAALG